MKKHYLSNGKPFVPLFNVLVVLMALDHWNVSDTWRAVILTIMGIIWLVLIIGFFFYKEVDLFKKEDREKFIKGHFDEK